MIGNSLLARKERQRAQRLHRNRLRDIRKRRPGFERKSGARMDGGFDNAPPFSLQFQGRVNRKKELDEERRCQQIERSNQLLLQRIQKAHAADGALVSASKERAGSTGPKSLNVAARRQNLIRIVQENEKILQRINTTGPMISARKWEEDFEKKAAVREQLSKDPNPNPNCNS